MISVCSRSAPVESHYAAAAADQPTCMHTPVLLAVRVNVNVFFFLKNFTFFCELLFFFFCRSHQKVASVRPPPPESTDNNVSAPSTSRFTQTRPAYAYFFPSLASSPPSASRRLITNLGGATEVRSRSSRAPRSGPWTPNISPLVLS